MRHTATQPTAAPGTAPAGPADIRGARDDGRRVYRRPFDFLLRIPLFYKLLLANGAIIALGAVAGTSLTAAFVRASPERSTLELVGLLGLTGVVLSVMVNAAILRLALRPLRDLEDTARRVEAGDLEARAPSSQLSDRQIERLTDTFNAMLESVAGYRQRIREVAARALNAAEAERKRVARELHDDTAQRLAALLIRLRIVRGMTSIEDRNRVLEDVRSQITETLEGVRHFAQGLRPPALDELGLVPAIQSYARTLTAASGLRITVNTELSDRHPMPPEAELALYRIVQEALSNVLRHARADSADVTLWISGDTVVATVEDDGRGFAVDRAVARPGEGLGLFGMQERAAYLGGTVDIESEPGAGTRVRVVIPRTAAGDG